MTREQAAKLDGFDKAFAQADKNQDGKLSQDEFNAAWAISYRQAPKLIAYWEIQEPSVAPSVSNRRAERFRGNN